MPQLKKLVPYIVCSIITLVFLGLNIAFYSMNVILIIQTILSLSIGFVFYVFEIYSKISFPYYLHIIICLQIFLSNALGSILGFYNRFSYWDTFVHATFGFVASAIFYGLIIYCKVMNKWIIFFFSSLMSIGTASLWEIFEFCADTLLGIDTQQVIVSQLKGVSPIKDTITDISVSLLGVICFFIYKFFEKLFAKSSRDNRDNL